MKKLKLLVLIFLLNHSIAIAQRVGAYQAGSYQAGLMNTRDLAVATESGLTFLDYNYWNTSDSYYDHNGNKLTRFEIDQDGINTTLDFTTKISGYINVPVLYYASDFKLLGGRYLASINPLFLSSSNNILIHSSASDSTIISSGRTGGFGDMSIMPFGLGWSFNDKIDISFLYTVYLPTGRYESEAIDNLGKGYWTHQIQAPIYFYFQDQATALFVMPTYEMNSKVKNSDVRPGNRISLEYGISQYLTPWLEVEILNGHNWQVSNDQGKDVWWSDTPLSTKDHTSTVGFGVGIWPWEGRLNIRAKYAMDYWVKERYKSNFLSLSVIFIPNLLSKKDTK